MQAGTILAENRYTILKQLGEGTFGSTFLALEESSRLKVVVKPIGPIVVGDDREFNNLIKNFHFVHHLDHPCIAQLHALEYDAKIGQHFLVIEYIDGQNLNEFRKKQPDAKLTVLDALHICQQIADVLDHSHRTILHRNLKPENIFIYADGMVKLTDFCLTSEAMRAQLLQSRTICQGGQTFPHPYLAPEQLFSFPPPGPAADRYALAAIFYELVAGSPPPCNQIKSTELAKKNDLVGNESFKPLDKLSKRQNIVLAEALSQNPALRYPSAGEFIEALTPTRYTTLGSHSHTLMLLGGLTLIGGLTALLLFSDGWGPAPFSATPPQTENQPLNNEITTLALQIHSVPEGANLILNDQSIGQTPFIGKKVLKGRYHIRLEKSGYKTTDIEVTLNADTRLDLTLVAEIADKTIVSEQEPLGKGLTKHIQELLDAANQDIKADRLTAPVNNNAYEKLHQVLDWDPNNAEAKASLTKIVDIYLKLTDENATNLEEAAKYLEKASTIQPNDPRIKEYEKKMDVWLRERRLTVLLELAQNHVDANRLTQPDGNNALEVYQQILRIDPNHAEALTAVKGMINDLLKEARADIKAERFIAPDRQNALEKFRFILKIDPNNTDAQAAIESLFDHYLTLAKKAKNDVDEMNRQLDMANKVRPDDSRIELYRQKINTDLQKKAESEQQQKIHDTLQRAQHYLEADQLTRPEQNNAWTQLQAVLQLDPENGAAKAGIDQLVEKLFRFVDIDIQERRLNNPPTRNALEKLRTLEEIRPNEPRIQSARERIGTMYLEMATQTQGEKAEQYRQQATLLLPKSSTTDTPSNPLEQLSALPQGEIETLLKQAQDDLEAQRLTQPSDQNAMVRFKKVLQYDPQNQRALAGLREVAHQLVLFAQQDLKEERLSKPANKNALDRFRLALEVDPNNQEAQQGIRDVARALLKMALEMATKKPNNAEPLFQKAALILPEDEEINLAYQAFKGNNGIQKPLEQAPVATPPPISQPVATTEAPPITNQPPQGAPSPLANAEIWREPSTDISFVHLPKGCFQMGSQPNDSDEEPTHEVCVDSFWMGQYEITQEQWVAVMGQRGNPSRFQMGKEYPVDQVSWNEAQLFIKTFSNLTKKQFRLPTEAEWEYACRANTTTPFSFGATIQPQQANYNANLVYGQGSTGVYRRSSTPVGSFPPNGFHIFDMHGNLYEWVEDWYEKSYYHTSPKNNPKGGDGTSGMRVLRGGAWYSNPENLRCGYRYRGRPDIQNYGNGMRLVYVSP
ncbi:MAG: SUMF1/EgtB/PvdO family nonheme iron enzyme [Magnetococcus sp. DMHC-6]